jgi:aspartyl/glutamyl-tRNA(Asn/Gln) amidotransferase C subunit
MRDDAAGESLTQEKALANAPEKAAGHYKVPKIIE